MVVVVVAGARPWVWVRVEPDRCGCGTGAGAGMEVWWRRGASSPSLNSISQMLTSIPSSDDISRMPDRIDRRRRLCSNICLQLGLRIPGCFLHICSKRFRVRVQANLTCYVLLSVCCLLMLIMYSCLLFVSILKC